MKRLGASLRLATVFAVVACVLAGTAASAMAVSIEPLSTKFEGTNAGSTVKWNDPSIGTWKCETATLTGTTRATKTNVVEVTPAFSKCGEAPFTFEYSNSPTICEPEGFKGLPWTVTLNAGGTASVKLNCSLVDKEQGGLCTVAAPSQTITSGVFWKNEGANTLGLEFSTASFKSFQHSGSCTWIPVARTLSAKYTIKGIHAS
jgi:hypothetical protein